MSGTGTGKTHLATAVGVAAIHKNKRVRFYIALERENQASKTGAMARNLIQVVLLLWMSWVMCPILNRVVPCYFT